MMLLEPTDHPLDVFVVAGTCCCTASIVRLRSELGRCRQTEEQTRATLEQTQGVIRQQTLHANTLQAELTDL